MVARDPASIPPFVRLVFQINDASFSLFLAFALGFLIADGVSDRTLTRIGFPWNQLSWFIAVSAIVRLASRWAFPAVVDAPSDEMFVQRWTATVTRIRSIGRSVGRGIATAYRVITIALRACGRFVVRVVHGCIHVGQTIADGVRAVARTGAAVRAIVVAEWAAARRFAEVAVPVVAPLLDGITRIVRGMYAVIDTVVVAVGIVVSAIARVLWRLCRNVGWVVWWTLRVTVVVVRIAAAAFALAGVTGAAFVGDGVRLAAQVARNIARRVVARAVWCAVALRARGWPQLLSDAFVVVLLWHLLAALAVIAIPDPERSASIPSVPLVPVVLLGILAFVTRSARGSRANGVVAQISDARWRWTRVIVHGGAVATSVLVAWVIGAMTIPLAGVIIGVVAGCLADTFVVLWLTEDANDRWAEADPSPGGMEHTSLADGRSTFHGAWGNASWYGRAGE